MRSARSSSCRGIPTQQGGVEGRGSRTASCHDSCPLTVFQSNVLTAVPAESLFPTDKGLFDSSSVSKEFHAQGLLPLALGRQPACAPHVLLTLLFRRLIQAASAFLPSESLSRPRLGASAHLELPKDHENAFLGVHFMKNVKTVVPPHIIVFLYPGLKNTFRSL